MTVNSFNHRSKISFKHYNQKHDEKICIIKMCRKKLKVSQKKDSIAKTVLIRNTLKIVETEQNINQSFYESEEEKENNCIDTLLRELEDYNLQLSSLKPISPLNDSGSSPSNSQVLEDFHEAETFSSNKLVFNDDDLSTLIELSQNQ